MDREIAEPEDPLWAAVLLGTRFTQTTAAARFPTLNQVLMSRAQLPFIRARKPATKNQRSMYVKTYARLDVEALVGRLAAPVAAAKDPLWVAVSVQRREESVL